VWMVLIQFRRNCFVKEVHKEKDSPRNCFHQRSQIDLSVANCQHLQIVNIFSTTLSTTNHPLLYSHYIYAFLSHVNWLKTEERREKA
jgi:hypothetical protein